MKVKVRLKRKLLKKLGVKIREYRLKKQISQEKLAFEIGVDRTYIGAIEQGLRSPSLYCLFVIAHALNVPITEIVNIDLND